MKQVLLFCFIVTQILKLSSLQSTTTCYVSNCNNCISTSKFSCSVCTDGYTQTNGFCYTNVKVDPVPAVDPALLAGTSINSTTSSDENYTTSVITIVIVISAVLGIIITVVVVAVRKKAQEQQFAEATVYPHNPVDQNISQVGIPAPMTYNTGINNQVYSQQHYNQTVQYQGQGQIYNSIQVQGYGNQGAMSHQINDPTNINYGNYGYVANQPHEYKDPNLGYNNTGQPGFNYNPSQSQQVNFNANVENNNYNYGYGGTNEPEVLKVNSQKVGYESNNTPFNQVGYENSNQNYGYNASVNVGFNANPNADDKYVYQ